MEFLLYPATNSFKLLVGHLPRPALSILATSNGAVEIAWPNTEELAYSIQAADSLSSPIPWVDAGSATLGSDGVFRLFILPDTLRPRRYYRLSGSRLASGTLLADSVAEFSVLQGQDNWFYGYCVGAYSKDGFSQFTTPFNCCGFGDAWSTGQNVWTSMWRWGGHPNGLSGNQGKDVVLHTAVRRWVSEINGTVRITGSISNCDGPDLTCNGGSTSVNIFVDGLEVFGAGSVESSYSIETALALGQVVDFTIDSGGNDIDDGTTFTAQVHYLHE